MEARLSDADSVWTDVRHMHMRDAIDKLMADFNGFLKEHGGFSAKSVPQTNGLELLTYQTDPLSPISGKVL